MAFRRSCSRKRCSCSGSMKCGTAPDAAGSGTWLSDVAICSDGKISASASIGSSLSTDPRDGFGIVGARARRLAPVPGAAVPGAAATMLRLGMSGAAGAVRRLRAADGTGATRAGTEAAGAGGTAASTDAPGRSGTHDSWSGSLPGANAPRTGGSANTRKPRDRLAGQPTCSSMFTTGSSTGMVVVTRTRRSPVPAAISTRARTKASGNTRSPKVTSALTHAASMLSPGSTRSAITKLSG